VKRPGTGAASDIGPAPRPRVVARCAGVVAVALVAAGVVASGCSTTRGQGTAAQAGERSPPAPAGQVAVLRAIGGSAVAGKIRVVDRGEGASVLVSVINLPRDFRIVFHANPNCSSPNGYSAGPAWAPAGRQALDLVPTMHANTEGRAETEARVAGMHATGPGGVAGRSVVVYEGLRATEARPDVPNERIACGVFEPAQPLAF
jgi:Cu/Zn superoxide dismutase